MSSLALRLDGDVWLFDAGEATQHRLRDERCNVKLSKITHIFITHMHGDHCYGLPGLMCTLGGSMSLEAAESFVLSIVGPAGLRAYLRHTLRLTHVRLPYRYVVHELCDASAPQGSAGDGDDMMFGEVVGENLVPSEDGLWYVPVQASDSKRIDRIVAGSLEHTVPSVGYVVHEAATPGSLNPKVVIPHLMRNKEALRAEGVSNPMSLLGRVKAGETLHLPDGTVVHPEQCVGPPVQGRILAILGDSSNSNALIPAAQGATIVVHEATNACLAQDAPATVEEVEAVAIAHGHSTPQMAGRFARAVGASMLLLNHFSSRYHGDDSPESRAVMDEIVAQAQHAMGGTQSVIATHDFYMYRVPR